MLWLIMSIGSRFVFVSRIHRLDYTRRAVGHVEYGPATKARDVLESEARKQKYIAYYLMMWREGSQEERAC